MEYNKYIINEWDITEIVEGLIPIMENLGLMFLGAVIGISIYHLIKSKVKK